MSDLALSCDLCAPRDASSGEGARLETDGAGSWAVNPGWKGNRGQFLRWKIWERWNRDTGLAEPIPDEFGDSAS